VENHIKLISKETRTLNHLYTTRIMTRNSMHMHRYGLAFKGMTSRRKEQG